MTAAQSIVDQHANFQTFPLLFTRSMGSNTDDPMLTYYIFCMTGPLKAQFYTIMKPILADKFNLHIVKSLGLKCLKSIQEVHTTIITGTHDSCAEHIKSVHKTIVSLN